MLGSSQANQYQVKNSISTSLVGQYATHVLGELPKEFILRDAGKSKVEDKEETGNTESHGGRGVGEGTVVKKDGIRVWRNILNTRNAQRAPLWESDHDDPAERPSRPSYNIYQEARHCRLYDR